MALFICSSLALAGCASFSTMGTARTLGRGRAQLLVAPEGTGAVTRSGIGVLPQLELGVRYGLTDDLELGAKAWYLGGSLDAKVQLRRSASVDSGFDLALDPTVGWQGPNKLTLGLPLLLGVNFSGGHQLVLGPRVVDQLWFDPGRPAGSAASTLSVGTSVGFAWKVSEGVRIMPEVSLLLPAISPPAVSTSAGSGVAFQGGFGVLVGGY